MDDRLHIIIGDRQSGKTSKIIDEASKNNGIIVTPTFKMVNNVEKVAQEEHESIPVITESELKTIRGNRINAAYYDELGISINSRINLFIQMLINNNVKMATVDSSTIDNINRTLSKLNITDIDGKPIKIKIVDGEENEKFR